MAYHFDTSETSHHNAFTLSGSWSMQEYAITATSDVPVKKTTDEDDAEWSELEKTLPSHDQLIASARKHRAPQAWYDEDHKAI